MPIQRLFTVVDGATLRKEYGDTRCLSQLLLDLKLALLSKNRRAASYLQFVLAVALERTTSLSRVSWRTVTTVYNLNDYSSDLNLVTQW